MRHDPSTPVTLNRLRSWCLLALFALSAISVGCSTWQGASLVRRTPSDWVHVGIVLRADQESMRTIEGNTNDSGSPDGFEVCERTRNYAGKDFVVWDPSSAPP